MTTEDTRSAALERLRSMMKKDVKRQAKTRKYKLVFSHPAFLEVDGAENPKAPLLHLALCHGLSDQANLAQYLDGDDLETLDIAGGDVAVRFDAAGGRLWLDVSYRMVRKPGKTTIDRLREFTIDQMSDGWGESAEFLMPLDVVGQLGWRERPERAEVTELDPAELRREEERAARELGARVAGIDAQIGDSLTRLREQ